jgi:hypothetical protein
VWFQRRGTAPATAARWPCSGYDPGRQRAPLKRKIGIVLQSTGVEPYLTVSETIRMYAGFYPDPRPVDEVIGPDPLPPARRRHPAGRSDRPIGADGFTEFQPDDVTEALRRLTGWALERKESLDGLEVIRPTLEDVYLSLTGAHSGGSPAGANRRPAAGTRGPVRRERAGGSTRPGITRLTLAV